MTLATGSMVIGTLIGMSLAYIRHTKEFRFASLIDACVWILLVSPSFIIAQGWVMFASPSGVALNTFGIDVSQLVFSTGGIIAVMALTNFPLSYLATSAALNWNTSSLWEAAASLGVSPWTVFWTLRLPLLAPAVISGALLVFVETLGDFGLPAAISSQYNFPTLPYSIYASVRQSPVNFALGGVLSLYLVIIVAIAIFIYLRILRSSSFSFLSGSSVQNTKRQSRISGLYSLISIVAFIVTLGIPIGSSLQVSLSERLADGFTISNLTLAHYEQALEMGSNLMNGIRNSVIIAVVVALLTTLLGLMMAISMTFTNFAGNKLLDLAGTVSLAVPGIVLAVGYIFVWNQPALNTINLDLYGTPVLLVFSGVAAALPIAVRLQMGALGQVSEYLVTAASVTGVGFFRRIRSILLPLVGPAVISAFAAVLAASVFDLAGATMLAPPSFDTLPVEILAEYEKGEYGYATAGAMISMVLMIILVAFSQIVGKRLMRQK